MAKNKLILGCGIGRCGTGFLSYFMFLNPQIAVWDGPGMGELMQAAGDHTVLSLELLHLVWGDDFQEPTHAEGGQNKDWTGRRDFDGYHQKRIQERRNSKYFFVSHVMGERWYPVYRDHFDCDIAAVYCARNMVDHYRSFKRWYRVDGTPEAYCERLRGSLSQMDEMKTDGIPIITIRPADATTIKRLQSEMNRVMKTLGIPISKEQTLFLKKRRKLGASKASLSATDAELMAELEQVEDFSDLKMRYENLI